jgi:hypothetical protein
VFRNVVVRQPKPHIVGKPKNQDISSILKFSVILIIFWYDEEVNTKCEYEAMWIQVDMLFFGLGVFARCER